MQFSVDLTLQELMDLDIDIKGLISGKDGFDNRKFKFSTLAKKRKRRNKDSNDKELTN